MSVHTRAADTDEARITDDAAFEQILGFTGRLAIRVGTMIGATLENRLPGRRSTICGIYRLRKRLKDSDRRRALSAMRDTFLRIILPVQGIHGAKETPLRRHAS